MVACTSFASYLGGDESVLAAFLAESWGVRPFTTALQPEVLAELLDGFGGGELTAVLPHCRKADNSPYAVDEMESMERDLETHARTLDLPYCFTAGAHRLSDAWVSACAERGHDVEVGAYFSNSRTIHAEWHRDENHNFTFQLLGSKDWYHTSAEAPDRGARPDASRGMFDAPRNRAEQLARAPPAGLAGCACVSMAPGSVLYLPPGHWHRVVPVAGPCVSVNLRIGQLLRARWLCEALFAALAAAPHDGGGALARELGVAAMCPAGTVDFGASAPSGAMRELAASARDALPRLLRACPLPRALPSERALSDGLERGASLSFLVARGCLARTSDVGPDASMRPSALVALALKARGADRLLVHVTGASALTGTEFLRFSVLCAARVEPGVRLLLEPRGSTVAQMTNAVGAGAAARELVDLLRALLYAGALVVHAGRDADARPDAHLERKRRKRRSR
ncbi:hypothetical protein KFE25_009638 [Diacronema lutheri]|uniref:JmjC domain-containing protein n=1 Tax=Diacronema lutheri TaxID=2081491 RepID=A0A8J6CDP6_DIALT|nr:hypothetical protein KFE25_009638 [Diacronema lutheri]